MVKTYDLAIIGSGPAGMFCALKIAQKYKNVNCALIDFGRPPAKRRRQLEGAMGALPSSDMRFYLSDLDKVANITGKRATSFANKYVIKTLSNVTKCNITKDKLPKSSVIKKFNEHNFEIFKNDFIQLYPKDIHSLSRQIFPEMEDSGNIDFYFDTSVYSLNKKYGTFNLNTESGEIQAKKVLIASGRAGWFWASNLFKELGLIEENDVARIGLRLEVPANNMKDFNKSHCSIIRNDLELGPLSWNGTIIPEDHYLFASSEFRSNEKRWASKNVSFKLTGNVPFKDSGVEQANRLSQLTFILTNDRISKEKISSFINGKSKISIMNEYDWFKEKLIELQEIIPHVIDKGYFHVPTISTTPPKINIGSNLETEINGLFVAGECAGINGLLSASVMGAIAANGICK